MQRNTKIYDEATSTPGEMIQMIDELSQGIAQIKVKDPVTRVEHFTGGLAAMINVYIPRHEELYQEPDGTKSLRGFKRSHFILTATYLKEEYGLGDDVYQGFTYRDHQGTMESSINVYGHQIDKYDPDIDVIIRMKHLPKSLLQHAVVEAKRLINEREKVQTSFKSDEDFFGPIRWIQRRLATLIATCVKRKGAIEKQLEEITAELPASRVAMFKLKPEAISLIGQLEFATYSKPNSQSSVFIEKLTDTILLSTSEFKKEADKQLVTSKILSLRGNVPVAYI